MRFLLRPFKAIHWDISGAALTSLEPPAFQVQKSSVFRRNGADIHSDLLISIAQAVLGGTARCRGLYDTINITVSTAGCVSVPERSRPTLRLAGGGVNCYRHVITV